MSKDVPFNCSCGAVSGVLRDIRPRSGGHLRCYCADCKQAAVWSGDVTPTPDGIHYYQTTPDRIDFIAGLADLRVFKWKEGRLLRWYAPCCGSPMFNTLDSPQWAFASINTERFNDPDALGPAIAFAFKPVPDGKSKTKGYGRFIIGFTRRTIWARVSGAWRNTPFFETTGETITPIKQLTEQDRAGVRQPKPV